MGSRSFHCVLLLLLVLLARCEAGGARAWVSTRSGRHILVKTGAPEAGTSVHPGHSHITIQTNQPAQVMLGFGAAMTEASSILISQAADSDRILNELFGVTNGIGISILRLPVGATDFSTELHSCQNEEGEPFSVEREKKVMFPPGPAGAAPESRAEADCLSVECPRLDERQ